MLPINLKQTPPYSNAFYCSIALYDDDVKQCPIKSYQLNWLWSINSDCIPIKCTVYSKALPTNTVDAICFVQNYTCTYN